MPRLLFNFRCDDMHVHESFVDTDIKELECPEPECGKTAKRLLSAPFFPLRQGVDTDMPTAAARWAKMQRAKNSEKVRDDNNERYKNEN
jgi:hypothetical protein